ncbi:hypothetical protein ACFL6C_02070 [Myxococcota bacterium]
MTGDKITPDRQTSRAVEHGISTTDEPKVGDELAIEHEPKVKTEPISNHSTPRVSPAGDPEKLVQDNPFRTTAAEKTASDLTDTLPSPPAVALRIDDCEHFDVRDHWEEVFSAFPDLRARGPSLLGQLGIDPAECSAIVLLSPGPYLGDTLFHTFAQIPYLRQKYPDTPIKLICPSFGGIASNIASTTEGVEHVDLTLPNVADDFAQVRADPDAFLRYFARVVSDALSKDALVIWNRSSLTALGSMGNEQDLGNPGRGTKTLDAVVGNLTNRVTMIIGRLMEAHACHGINEEDSFQAANQFTFVGAKPELARVGNDLAGMVRRPHGSVQITLPIGERRTQASPVHYHTLLAKQLLFGPDAYLDWPRKSFLKPGDGATDGTTNVRRVLEDQHLDDPQAPFVIVNLRTGGIHKQKIIRTNGRDLLNGILDGIQDRFPRANVLVAAPNNEMSHDFREQVTSLMREKNQGRVWVGSMPDDLSRWAPVVADSSFVITWCSGLSHLAPILLSPDRVMTISAANAGLSRHWRHPGQPFAHIMKLRSQTTRVDWSENPRLSDAAFHHLIDQRIYPFIDAQVARIRTEETEPT